MTLSGLPASQVNDNDAALHLNTSSIAFNPDAIPECVVRAAQPEVAGARC
jgi:hypothetical protein